jgi:hypothetical protein
MILPGVGNLLKTHPQVQSSVFDNGGRKDEVAPMRFCCSGTILHDREVQTQNIVRTIRRGDSETTQLDETMVDEQPLYL